MEGVGCGHSTFYFLGIRKRMIALGIDKTKYKHSSLR